MHLRDRLEPGTPGIYITPSMRNGFPCPQSFAKCNENIEGHSSLRHTAHLRHNGSIEWKDKREFVYYMGDNATIAHDETCWRAAALNPLIGMSLIKNIPKSQHNWLDFRQSP